MKPHLRGALVVLLATSLAAFAALAQDGSERDARRPRARTAQRSTTSSSWYPFGPAPRFAGARVQAGVDEAELLYAGNAVFHAGEPPEVPAELRKSPRRDQAFEPGYFIVHHRGPVGPTDKVLLDALTGPTLRDDGSRHTRWYLPNNGLVAFVPDAVVLAALEGLDNVNAVDRYEPAYKLDPTIGTATLTSPDRVDRGTYFLNLDLMPGYPTDLLVRELMDEGVRVVDRVETRGRRGYDVRFVVVEALPDQITEIAFLEGVRMIQESGDGKATHDLSGGGKLQNRTLSQDDQAASPIVSASAFPLWLTHDLQGQGQLIGVVDSNLDWNNAGTSGCGFGFPDLAIDNWGFADPNLARVLYGTVQAGGVNLKIPWADELGGAVLGSGSTGLEHGTGTSGAALADFYGDDDQKWWEHDVDSWESWAPQNFSGLLGPGIAHEAQLYFTPVDDQSGGFRWEFIGEFEANMQVTLNNMGAAGVCSTNHSVGIVESSNTYTQTSVAHDTAAFDNPDMLQCISAGNSGAVANALTSQAVVKNAMTVGASDDVLRAEDRVTFSSIGPTFDGRIKPDVMAPGDDTTPRDGGTNSLLILPDSNGTGSGSCSYQYTAGTSFSSPIIAGAAALVHQYFEEGRYPGSQPIGDPSAALMKAVLVNGGHRLTGANLGDGNYPNDYQGWGEPNLSDVLDLPGGARRLIASDVSSGAGFLSAADPVQALTFDVDGSVEGLRVTLVWTDEPGSAGQGKKLINDLDLVVQSPGGSTYLGNVFDAAAGESLTGGSADTLNNVESVILSGPSIGSWTVTVDPGAGNYSVGQGYALVVTGQVSESGPAAPNASFSGTPTSGTVPLTVSFTDQSSGTPTSWSWDFGDGGSSTLQDPSHAYTVAGAYSVSLTATNANGSDSFTRTDYVTASDPVAPTADFVGAPTSGSAPLTVSFTDQSGGDPASWTWDFGDGGSSSAQNPSHVYAAEGTYTVGLTASNANGSDTLTRTNYVTVTSVPSGEGYVLSRNADFSTDDRVFSTSDTLHVLVFSDQVDFDDLQSAQWQLQDASLNRVRESLTSNGDGTYTASFDLAGLPSSATSWDWAARVTDNANTRFQPADTITIDEAVAPTADFSGSPTTGTAPLSVSFSDLSSGTPTSWSWDFGDGGSSSAQNPSHVYAAGTYTVSLTASNANGSDTLTRTGYVTVSNPPPPAADFVGTPTSGTTPLTVAFSDLSTGGPTSWSWDFGDGGSSSAQNPTHVYSVADAYTVMLTVSSANGSDSLTRVDYVIVSDPMPPTADFMGAPTAGTAPLTVGFTDQSTGDPTSWSWDFGDGGGSSAQNPSHVYSAAGTYSVSLTASNANGSDSLTRTDYIAVSAPPAPTADFSGTPTSGSTPLTVSFTDLSTDGPTSWSWDFGDGGSSSAQNPSHVYTVEGTYTVSLTASNASGSDTLTRTDYVTVTSIPAGEGFILSRNADFSTDDRDFTTADTLHVLVFSDQVDFDDLTSAQWQLQDASLNRVRETLTSNGDGTYSASFDLSGLPSSATDWTWAARIVDGASTRFQPSASITVTP